MDGSINDKNPNRGRETHDPPLPEKRLPKNREQPETKEKNGKIEQPENREPALDPESCLKVHPDLAAELKSLFQGISSLPFEEKKDREGLEKTPPESAGYIIDDFRIIRIIDSGGMGRVYEADQLSLNRRVALKVLFPHLSLSEKAVRMFQREAEAGSRLNHPGIVAIHAIGKHNGVHYIAQELVGHGVTLADRLDQVREEESLPRTYFKDMTILIAQVAEAMACMHESNVIHRDIKPTNILITHEGKPKVSDFGLARLEDSLSLTKTHSFSGTPYYMSPEQSSPTLEGIDHRTDVFSLGVTLYEALTLKRPFTGKSSREVQAKIQYLPPPNPREVRKQVPRDLAIICSKAMEKDRRRRYQTMRELAEDLQRFLEGKPIKARPAGKIYRMSRWIHRHPWFSVTTSAVVLAVATLLLLTALMARHKHELDSLLEQQYVPSRLALGWEKLDLDGQPWKWYAKADRGDPGSDMLEALFHVDNGFLGEAVVDLKSCIEKSRSRNHRALEQEARYLLYIVKRLQAHDEKDNEKRKEILDEARAVYDTLGESDPFALSTLIHRYPRAGFDEAGSENVYLQPVLLNTHHYLVPLYQGIHMFQTLYKGGEKGKYERAIDCFERVLEVWPQHVTALTFLGRVEFFYARSYNYLHMLDTAEQRLLKALELSRGAHYQLVHTTLGQIACMRLEFEKAEKCFRNAIACGGKDRHVHNAITGLGRIHVLQGDVATGAELYNRSLEIMPYDSYTHTGLAEIRLMDNKLDEALEQTSHANLNWDGKTNRVNQIIKPYLSRLRAHLPRKEYTAMLEDLHNMYRAAIRCPTHLSLACFVIASMPEEPEAEIWSKFLQHAGILSQTALFLSYDSPIALSGSGVSAYIHGDLIEAEDHIQRALSRREKWPKSLERVKSLEDARDLFFLAMISAARFDASRKVANAGYIFEKMAREAFVEAEEIYEKNYSPFLEYADILDRVRTKARDLLARSGIRTVR